ncbi:hypothetical protein YA62_024430 [Agrobacterium sp. LC34]|uniref:hypothetical protein n=1 Tax=Agrobacterium sp. LC34 TaxID=1643810 RepID=UPI0010C9B247|nr:hypothetical protein [Agrobacterium sp. LC34]TKT56303.1 hypothetical protein YA62_024430 [Agrobacterium sp. LC34]
MSNLLEALSSRAGQRNQNWRMSVAIHRDRMLHIGSTASFRFSSTLAYDFGLLLFRPRKELLGSDESGLAAPVDPQSVAPDPDPVVEIDIDGIVVRVGRHVEEAHLQRVIRAVRSA